MDRAKRVGRKPKARSEPQASEVQRGSKPKPRSRQAEGRRRAELEAGSAYVHLHGAASERVIARLRKLCLAFPGATEKLSHGEPTWFAGKVFVMFDDHHHGAPHLAVWLPLPSGAQEALVDADPARYFRPPYVGHRGWVGVRVDGRPDWGVVAGLVREAYLHVASRKLVAQLHAAE